MATRLLQPAVAHETIALLMFSTTRHWYEGTQNDVSMKPLLFQATEPGERDNRIKEETA